MESHRHADEQGLGPDPAEVRTVLAIRPGSLADVVRSVPALRHVRATYPGARIDVVAPQAAADLLAVCPYVDRFVAIEQPSEAIVERFDVALSWADPDASGGLEVEEVNARFRASWRADGTPQRRAIHPAWPVRMDDASRMLRLAWLLGGDLADDAGLGLWPSLADRNGAARLVVDAGRPIALVHVGAGDPQRQWPVERWVGVVDLLEAIGLDPVLVGTGSDRDAARQVLASVRQAPISLVDRTSLGVLCGLLERAALFVGADSAPAAMAVALDVRSVVIAPRSPFEYDCRPGRVDLVDAGACVTCGEYACPHGAPDAVDVSLDRALGQVDLAASAAVARWRREQIA
jgi:ADP-heptose:LPS heptosyltransferase